MVALRSARRRDGGGVLGALVDALRLAEEVVEVAEAAAREDALPAHATEAVAQKLQELDLEVVARGEIRVAALGGARDEALPPSQMSIASPRPVPAAMTATLAPRFFGIPALSPRKCSLARGHAERAERERDEVVEERDALDAELAPDEPRVDDPRQVRRHDPPADHRPGDPEGGRGHLGLGETWPRNSRSTASSEGYLRLANSFLSTVRPLGWSSERRAWVPPMSPTSSTRPLRITTPSRAPTWPRCRARRRAARRAVNASPKSHGADERAQRHAAAEHDDARRRDGAPPAQGARRAARSRTRSRARPPRRRAGRRASSGPVATAHPEREARGDPERGGRLEDERAQPILDAPRRGAHEEVVHRDGHGPSHRRRNPRGHATDIAPRTHGRRARIQPRTNKTREPPSRGAAKRRISQINRPLLAALRSWRLSSLCALARIDEARAPWWRS